MSEDVVLPNVKVPAELGKILTELCYLELRGDKIKLLKLSDVMREALIKGVELMLKERQVFQEMILQSAKEGALRIQASLDKKSEEGGKNIACK